MQVHEHAKQGSFSSRWCGRDMRKKARQTGFSLLHQPWTLAGRGRTTLLGEAAALADIFALSSTDHLDGVAAGPWAAVVGDLDVPGPGGLGDFYHRISGLSPGREPCPPDGGGSPTTRSTASHPLKPPSSAGGRCPPRWWCPGYGALFVQPGAAQGDAGGRSATPDSALVRGLACPPDCRVAGAKHGPYRVAHQ